jgi:hypothetical protein
MIHDSKYFTKEEILRRAQKYEYPNPIAVEYFLWDCELTAQLQSVCDQLTLKGGAATQLHLPIEKQRGSKDIDLVTAMDTKDISEIVEKTASAFKGCARFELYKPLKPTPNLPLQTYYAHLPSEIDPGREEIDVKIDFLCKCPELPSEVIGTVQTYALETKPIKCSTAGTLTGDKLLSLAQGSIGLDIEENYPKQIYDIDALIECSNFSKEFVGNFKSAIECLTETESTYRKLETNVCSVLKDIISTMHKYSLVDMPTGEPELKQQIDSFQQFYVNRSQRARKDEWSTKALRIRFLATLALEIFDQTITNNDVPKIISESRTIEKNLNAITGEDIQKTRNKLLEYARSKNIIYLKDLKGKPLNRVFWQFLTPENLSDIAAAIKS